MRLAHAKVQLGYGIWMRRDIENSILASTFNQSVEMELDKGRKMMERG